MQYFDEMDNKYGFGDGGAVPPDAWAAREVYCTVLNALLEKNKSKCRIVPYDRGGCHNPCLFLRVSKDYFDALKDKNDPDHSSTRDMKELETDEAWEMSVEQAMELNLDNYIETKVHVDENGLTELISKL